MLLQVSFYVYRIKSKKKIIQKNFYCRKIFAANFTQNFRLKQHYYNKEFWNTIKSEEIISVKKTKNQIHGNTVKAHTQNTVVILRILAETNVYKTLKFRWPLLLTVLKCINTTSLISKLGTNLPFPFSVVLLLVLPSNFIVSVVKSSR